MTNNTSTEKMESIPIEIPWQLASTSRVLESSENIPIGSSISIFTFVPRLKNLEVDYPDDRLIYLKVSISVSSDVPSDMKKALLTGDLPVWTSFLDIRLSPIPYAKGGIKPYFIAASPMRRTMLETGVIGDDRFEGESEGLAVGKSGSQLHESFATKTETSSKSVGGGIPLFFSASGNYTRTTVRGERDVVQIQDTTSRQASEERQELLSHLTNVKNVLTLLTSKEVGTPYLRFTLSPRPLRQLSIDPTDPYLWYSELLRHRSSGIEGIQDFYAIAVVPKGLKGFCVDTILRNVYLFDSIPAPPKFAPLTKADFPKILDYLNNLYPSGTPLDELDIDIYQKYIAGGGFQYDQPAVLDWSIDCYGDQFTRSFPFNYHVMVFFNGISPSGVGGRGLFYKTALEVKLDAELSKYESDLARSPIERGHVFFIPHKLQVCFNLDKQGGISVFNVFMEKGKYQTVPIGDTGIFIPPIPPLKRKISIPQGDIIKKNWFAWNLLENQLATHLSSLKDWGNTPLRFDHSRIIEIVLRNMENLNPDSIVNKSFTQILNSLNLKDSHGKKLFKGGVSNMPELIAMINNAELTERISISTKNLIEALPEHRDNRAKPETIEVPLSVEDSKIIKDVLGKWLQSNYEQILEAEINKPSSVKQISTKKIKGKK